MRGFHELATKDVARVLRARARARAVALASNEHASLEDRDAGLVAIDGVDKGFALAPPAVLLAGGADGETAPARVEVEWPL